MIARRRLFAAGAAVAAAAALPGGPAGAAVREPAKPFTVGTIFNRGVLRLSADPNDPAGGYDAWMKVRWKYDIKVYLDDKLVEGCGTADEWLGHVVRARRNAEGNMFVDENTDEIATELLQGKVRIELKEIT